MLILVKKEFYASTKKSIKIYARQTSCIYVGGITLSAIEKERGILLTIWLALMVVGSGIGAILYIFATDLMASAMPTVPTWVFYLLGILSILNIGFAIFLFRWKRWAFFAFCGIAVIGFVINIGIGLGIVSSLSGFLGPIILYLLMKPKWDLFE